jgi:multimeric flavodoxin WrbA
MKQKIEILIGSPRKRGNTYLMSKMLIDKLDKENFDSNVSFLYDYEIKPCIDCRGCKKETMVCILKDEMQDLYPRIEKADILIFATPIYWFGPSAKTKLMLDRLRPHYANKRLTGKRVALLLPAGTGAPDCDLTIEMFKRSAGVLQLNYIGEVTAKAYDIGEANQDESALDSISHLAAQITRAGRLG